MATLDQAFIKAYTQARQSPAPNTAGGAAAAPVANRPRIGSGALGLRSIGLTPRKRRAGEPTEAPPIVVPMVASPPAIEQAEPVAEQIVEQAVTLVVEQAIEQAVEPIAVQAVEQTVEPVIEQAAEPVIEQAAEAVFEPVVADSASETGEVIAEVAIEPIAAPPEIVAALPQATFAEAASSEARRAALDVVPVEEESESFAVSLVTPLVPNLILAESFASQPSVYYCESAESAIGFDQSNLLVWHPTTRDFIISESEMVVVPRFAPQIPAATDSPTSAATLEERRSVDRGPAAEAVSVSETNDVPTEAPTNRAVVVPPPLPKTLIPPAPETLSAGQPDAGEAPTVAAAAVEAATVEAAIAEAAAIETAAVEAATIGAAIGKPAFAPLSTFSPRLVGEVLRPQLEVDRFAWPEVCGLLLGRVETDFIRLAVELTIRLNDTNQVVAWTGCQRGEGRTTSLLCMAQRLSALGQRCVLVDADFSRPELARRLGISAQVGWEEIVGGGAQLSDVLIGSIEDKIALLPRRHKCAVGTHPGAGPRSAALFGMLREAFDVVLLDVGPMAGDAELADMASCAAAANVGGAYLVFDSRNTTTADMAATADSLRCGGINVWGAIENFRR